MFTDDARQEGKWKYYSYYVAPAYKTRFHRFTWAHSIDQGNEDLFDGGGGVTNIWDMKRERANSSLDRRLGFVLSSVYEIPLGKGHTYMSSGIANVILGGWQVGGVFSKYTGLPIPHTINVNNENMGGGVRGEEQNDRTRTPPADGGGRAPHATIAPRKWDHEVIL